MRRRYSAFMADGLSALYQDLLTGSYDCVDRIVLNGISKNIAEAKAAQWA
jgi:hypothetical protein